MYNNKIKMNINVTPEVMNATLAVVETNFRKVQASWPLRYRMTWQANWELVILLLA